MIETGELRRGVTIEIGGTLYQLLDVHHLKIGRGSAQVRMKLRDIKGGHTIERTVQAGERFTRATLETRSVQFLYTDDGLYHFMDTVSFEQFPVDRDQIEDSLPYMTENINLDMVFYQDAPIGVELPTTVTLRIVETPRRSRAIRQTPERSPPRSRRDSSSLCRCSSRMVSPLSLTRAVATTSSGPSSHREVKARWYSGACKGSYPRGRSDGASNYRISS